MGQSAAVVVQLLALLGRRWGRKGWRMKGAEAIRIPLMIAERCDGASRVGLTSSFRLAAV